MRPRTSAPCGMTSTPCCMTASSRTAVNCSPTLFLSLLTPSIMRITIFEPLGIVHAVFAAFEDVGRVTRSVAGTNRGVVELFGGWVVELAADDAEDEEVEVDVDVLSSPN